MNLFVRKVYVPAGGRNQWRIEAESPARASRFSFLHGAFDAAQDQLAGRAALARGGFVQPVVQIARHVYFFFNDTATTEIYTLSLHDALPISFWRDEEAVKSWRNHSKHRMSQA